MSRRLIVLIIVLLMFGAISTWGVAWACAWWVSLEGVPRLVGFSNAEPPLWVVRSWSTFGRSRIESWNHPHGINNDEVISSFWWSRVSRRPGDAVRNERHEFSSGLPFRSMIWWNELEVVHTGPKTGDWHHNVVARVGAWMPGTLRNDIFNTGDKVLPLRPIWIGFASNTLIFACLYGLLVYTLFFMRGRGRQIRGCCTACGYDLRGSESDRCSECGRLRIGAATFLQKIVHWTSPLFISLFLAIILTIAIAQACAYLIDVGQAPPRSGFSQAPPAPWHITRYDAFGSTRVIWESESMYFFFSRPTGDPSSPRTHHPRLVEVTAEQRARDVAAPELVPAWGRVIATPAERLSDDNTGGIEDARGWPFRCMWWECQDIDDGPRGGIPLTPSAVGATPATAMRAFPLLIDWAGFCINVLIFATVIYLSLIALMCIPARR